MVLFTLGSLDTLIKYIVMLEHVTFDDDCDEKAEDEFVVVVQGAARLFYVDSKNTMELGVGDHVFIPAGVKHSVEWCRFDNADCVVGRLFHMTVIA